MSLLVEVTRLPLFKLPLPLRRTFATQTFTYSYRKMGKKKSSVPSEELLLLPYHQSNTTGSSATIVDTHTHLASTFAAYRGKYKAGKFETVFDFVRGMYEGRKVEAIVDVWCEAPVQKLWKEFADSALNSEERERNWGGMEYWFVMGELIHWYLILYEG
jgi:hypothetical protein